MAGQGCAARWPDGCGGERGGSTGLKLRLFGPPRGGTGAGLAEHWGSAMAVMQVLEPS